LVEEMQLNPQDLRNELWLSKDDSGKSAWQMAAEGRNLYIIEELLDWTK